MELGAGWLSSPAFWGEDRREWLVGRWEGAAVVGFSSTTTGIMIDSGSQPSQASCPGLN